MTSKLKQELNKITGQKYAAINKWETKKSETEQRIDELEEKLSSPEVLDDYSEFSNLSTQLSEAKSYLEQIEGLIRKESSPNDTERKLLATYKEKTKQECKSIHDNLCEELQKYTKKMLPLIEQAEAEQNEIMTAFSELNSAFSGQPVTNYSLSLETRPYNPDYDPALRDIKDGIKRLSPK